MRNEVEQKEEKNINMNIGILIQLAVGRQLKSGIVSADAWLQVRPQLRRPCRRFAALPLKRRSRGRMLNCSSSSDAEGVLNMSRVNRGDFGGWTSEELAPVVEIVLVASWASDEDLTRVEIVAVASLASDDGIAGIVAVSEDTEASCSSTEDFAGAEVAVVMLIWASDENLAVAEVAVANWVSVVVARIWRCLRR